MSKKKNNIIPVPESIEEAFAILDQIVTDEDKKAITEGNDCRFGLVEWIRENWSYEEGFINLYRDHLLMSSVDIDFNESIFHIIGIPKDIDVDRLCEDAGKYCSDNGFSGEIKTFVTDEQKEIEQNEDDMQICTAVLLGSSTQGVEISYFSEQESAHMHFQLPNFGSPGDVKLAFALMNQLKEQYPDCGIYYNDNTDGEFGLVEQNIDAIEQLCFENFASIIEASAGGKHPVIPGFQNEFVLPSPDDNPEKSLESLVVESVYTFINLQWNYTDITRASRAYVTSPEGEEYSIRFLSNNCDTFVGTCERLALSGPGEKIKEVEPIGFIKLMEGNPYFERVDFLQFVIRKMPAKDWNNIIESIDGKILA